MKPEELELKINDAADGLLTASELRELEQALEQYPDLLQSYRDIMRLPDLSKAYGEDLDAYRNDLNVYQIRKEIDKIWELSASFEETILVWFRQYALAASLLIFALTSFFYVIAPETYPGEEVSPDEYIYPDAETSAEGYVLYLDEWMEQHSKVRY